MRTTITLEPDVAHQLQEFSRSSGRSFKQAVNDAVRQGLANQATVRAEAFVQPTFHLGKVRIDLTKALALSSELEDQEAIAKIGRR